MLYDRSKLQSLEVYLLFEGHKSGRAVWPSNCHCPSILCSAVMDKKDKAAQVREKNIVAKYDQICGQVDLLRGNFSIITEDQVTSLKEKVKILCHLIKDHQVVDGGGTIIQTTLWAILLIQNERATSTEGWICKTEDAVGSWSIDNLFVLMKSREGHIISKSTEDAPATNAGGLNKKVYGQNSIPTRKATIPKDLSDTNKVNKGRYILHKCLLRSGLQGLHPDILQGKLPLLQPKRSKTERSAQRQSAVFRRNTHTTP